MRGSLCKGARRPTAPNSGKGDKEKYREVNLDKWQAGLSAALVALAVAASTTPGCQTSQGDKVDSARAQALQECSRVEQRYTEPSWGHQEIDVYRACMARHGQPE